MLPVEVRDKLNSIRPGGDFLSVENSLLAGRCRKLDQLDAWLLWNNTRVDSIGFYIDFLRRHFSTFSAIRGWFNLNVKASENEHKDANRTAGWAGSALIPMASFLYSLVKDGHHGAFVECGVFKGGTASCMSHVAAELGIEYYAADTFEGLPDGSGNGFYAKGQFKGAFEEVKSAVDTVGNPQNVVYLKGLFSDTLHSVEEPVLGVFLDTDLYLSSSSALEKVKSRLIPSSVIFSDGIGEGDLGVIRDHQGEEARAVFDFWAGRTFSYEYCGFGHMSVCAASETPANMTFTPAFIKVLVALLIAERKKWPVYKRYDGASMNGLTNFMSDMIQEAAY